MLSKQALSDQTSNWFKYLTKVYTGVLNKIFLRVQRSQIHLHLGDCPRRVLQCDVKGCNNFYPIGGKSHHDRQYQESHQVMLKNEVEKLKGKIFSKVRDLRLPIDHGLNLLGVPLSYEEF